MHAGLLAEPSVVDAHGLAPDTSASSWRAHLELHFAPRRERTALWRRRQRGPLLVQRPFYPEGDDVCHAYIIHPPAGIVGGDRLGLSVTVDSGAHALLTTPGATRWYFSREKPAHFIQDLTVGAGAVLEWLPQETLLFDGAHARLATRVTLAERSRFIGWEILGLGRPACGEDYRDGTLDFRFELHRADQPLLLERLRDIGGVLPNLRGNTAVATLMALPADDAALEAARTVAATETDALSGITRIGDRLLCRAVAPHCQPILRLFHRLWSELRPRVLGRPAVAPRIWQT